MVGIISQIHEGDLNRFKSEETENGLIVLELFPENEYPFNSEITSSEEINSVKGTVKGFMGRFAG